MKTCFFLLAFAVLVSSGVPAEDSDPPLAKVHALVVGIGNSNDPLDYAPEKARKFVAFLEGKFGTTNVNAVPQIFDPKDPATLDRDKFLASLKQVADSAEKDSLVFVYFCGHGERDDTSKELLLSLSGGNILNFDTILTAVQFNLKGRFVFLIIDACESGFNEADLNRVEGFRWKSRVVACTATDKETEALDGAFTESLIGVLGEKGRQTKEQFINNLTQDLRRKGYHTMFPEVYSGETLIHGLTGFASEKVVPVLLIVPTSLGATVEINLGEANGKLTFRHNLYEAGSPPQNVLQTVIPMVLPYSQEIISVKIGSLEVGIQRKKSGKMFVYSIDDPDQEKKGFSNSGLLMRDEKLLMELGAYMEDFGYQEAAHIAYVEAAKARAKRVPSLPSVALWERIAATDARGDGYGAAAKLAVDHDDAAMVALELLSNRTKVKEIGGYQTLGEFYEAKAKKPWNELAKFDVEKALAYGAIASHDGDKELNLGMFQLKSDDRAWANAFSLLVSESDGRDQSFPNEKSLWGEIDSMTDILTSGVTVRSESGAEDVPGLLFSLSNGGQCFVTKSDESEGVKFVNASETFKYVNLAGDSVFSNLDRPLNEIGEVLTSTPSVEQVSLSSVFARVKEIDFQIDDLKVIRIAPSNFEE